MILELDSFKYLVIFDKRYDLVEMRQITRVVPGSYAEEFLERIHNCLFKYARDVNEEYTRYYAIEYSDLGDFLYWKYEVDRPTARGIAEQASAGAFVGYTDDSIGMLLSDDVVSPIIENIFFQLGETSNENTN